MADLYKPQGALRCFLALCVLWSHSVVHFFPEAAAWFAPLQLGNVAVACFFVLSGYLMFEAARHWYASKPAGFLLNRYLRIAPPFLLATAVSLLIHFVLLDAFGELHGIDTIPPDGVTRNNALQALTASVFPFNILFVRLLDLTAASYDFVRFSWAIFTELLFYWALFGYLVLRRVLPGRWLDASAMFVALACAVIGFVAYNAALLPQLPIARLATQIPFAFHMQWAPHFMLGIAISVIAHRQSGTGVVFGVATGLAALLQLGVYSAAGRELTTALPVLIGYLFLVTAIVLVVCADPAKLLSHRWFTKAFDRRCGDLSYPIYINQYGLTVAFMTLAEAYALPLDQGSLPLRMAGFILYNLFIIVLAGLLIAVTDLVTRSLRQRIRGGEI